MHMHGIPSNPNFQLNALYAAERAEAKKAAERTRAELRRLAASTVSGFDDGEDVVVSLAGREDSQQQARQNGQDENGEGRTNQSPGASTADEPFSDYA